MSSDTRIAITGIGVVSPAGVGVAECFDLLASGRDLLVDLDQSWAVPPFNLGAPVGSFDARQWIAPRRLRRMNRLSQLAVVAAYQAARQAGIEPGAAWPGTGVVMGTGLGALAETVAFIEQLQDEDPSLANPGLFPSTVMNVAASQISMELGLQGYNTTVNHKEISAELALLLAVDALRLERAGAVLVGAVDELSEPVHHGYRRLGALARGRPRPYRAGRDGLALGEGAAVVVLEPLAGARARGAALAELAGISAAGGTRPLVGWGPAPEQGRTAGPALEAGVSAVRGALGAAGVDPGEVDLVIGSGCGSPDLDRLDAQVVAAVFGERPVPLTSPHGALGSWMGGGALRLVAAVEAIRRGAIFPTVTGGDPDPAVPAPGLVTAARQEALRTVLVCGHATGGGSAAAVLVRSDD
jgi:3-oxoacyl-[acyl-carrier-protein] synthase II